MMVPPLTERPATEEDEEQFRRESTPRTYTLRERWADYRAEAKRNRVFAASADGQVMPMRRGQRPWDSSSRPEARSGGSLTVWNPVRALAALASAEAPVRSALPAAPRSKARAVIEGTIVSQR